jgi:hypothetical protein
MQAQPGFLLGYAGRVQGTGLIASISYWADPQALSEAEPLMAKFENDRAAYGMTTESRRTMHLFAVPAYVTPQVVGV